MRRLAAGLLGTVLGLVAACTSVAAQSAPCRWVAKPPYVQLADGSPVPVLAIAVRGTLGDASVVPAYAWNPDLTRHGRVHAGATGTDSSIVTVSGGGCTPVRVAVLVHGDGYVAQRSVALDYGASQAHDEFDAGRGDVGTLGAHAEIGDPFGVRRTWLSTDVRSIAYLPSRGRGRESSRSPTSASRRRPRTPN